MGKALARAFKNSGFEVTVYNRSGEKAIALAEEIRVSSTEDLGKLLESELVILPVSDDSIAEVFELIRDHVDQQIIVHTSGTRSIDLLDGASNHGLFYPLDSFGYHGDWKMKDTPIFIEGSDDEILSKVKDVAYELSGQVYQLDSAKRPWLHLAAVIMNNFTNVLIAEAYHLLEDHDIPMNALDKLLRTTMLKATTTSPEESQTGPARRGDLSTIRKHMDMLDDAELAELYKLLSHRINKKLDI